MGARRRRGSAERRDAFGEPWTTAFRTDGAADADDAGPPSPGAPGERGERGAPGPSAGPVSESGPQPGRFGILVGRDAEPAVRLVTELPFAEIPRLHADEFRAPDSGHDAALVAALHRVADSFERVAASLDADRRERRSTLDDVDSMLRALVGELRSPAAVAPVVVAGSIDADTDGERPHPPGGDEIDLRSAGSDRPPDPGRRPFERARPH